MFSFPLFLGLLPSIWNIICIYSCHLLIFYEDCIWFLLNCLLQISSFQSPNTLKLFVHLVGSFRNAPHWFSKRKKWKWKWKLRCHYFFRTIYSNTDLYKFKKYIVSNTDNYSKSSILLSYFLFGYMFLMRKANMKTNTVSCITTVGWSQFGWVAFKHFMLASVNIILCILSHLPFRFI